MSVFLLIYVTNQDNCDKLVAMVFAISSDSLQWDRMGSVFSCLSLCCAIQHLEFWKTILDLKGLWIMKRRLAQWRNTFHIPLDTYGAPLYPIHYHHSSTIIALCSLPIWQYIIYSPVDAHCHTVHQLKQRYIAIYADSRNICVIDMKFSLLDGREDGEHNGIGVEEISKIFAIEDAIYFRMEPVDWV